MALSRAAAFVFLVLTNSIVFGDMIGMGGGGSIPDNNVNGVASTISFANSETITNMTLTINFGPIVPNISGHTYVGDLIATLTGPNGTMTVFDRVGYPATNFGDSSNLSGSYSWSDSGGSFSAAAAAVGNNVAVANGNYRAQNGSDGFLSFQTAFAGTNTAGDWTLRISDRAQTDVGGFVGWTLNIQSFAAIPEPSSAILLTSLFGIAGLMNSRRRQRRQRRRMKRNWY